MATTIGGNLRMMFPVMARHNETHPNCNPIGCDTLDEFSKAVEEWVDQLPEPMRLQMTVALLRAAQRVSDKHRTEDWSARYAHPEMCS